MLKTSALVRSEVLELFFYTLTAYHMFSCKIWEEFAQQVKKQLSSKAKTCSGIFIAILKST